MTFLNFYLDERKFVVIDVSFTTMTFTPIKGVELLGQSWFQVAHGHKNV